jgi:hypothetical protein
MSETDLRAEREALNDAVLTHEPSILRFQNPDRPWFRLFADEEPSNRALRHLSSSASCLESLAVVPSYHRTTALDLLEERVAGFAEAALKAPDDRWESEGAARVYCRVRTLVPILALTPTEVLRSHEAKIRELIRFVWDQLDPADETRQGIAEDPEGRKKRTEEITETDEGSKAGDERREEGAETDGPPPRRPEVAYPPNAFHTYWAIRLLEEYQRHEELAPMDEGILSKRPIAELWGKQMLGAQTSRIANKAERFDAHQLAWSLSLELLHTDEPSVTSATQRLDVYQAGLAAFFAQQLGSGRWPLYDPLFHYPAAGNAYCYTFETLAELLRPALHEDRGVIPRQLLKPYLPQLLKAWHFARDTTIATGPGTVGWCSGHHPHRTAAESWATASVFSFLQSLRCLVGYWTAETAAANRRARRPEWATPDEARQQLRHRGRTWARDGWTAGRRLAMLFMHPMELLFENRPELDPDRPLLQKEQARSGILFGPPGTSKTTLVEALAGTIGWDYVEIHASDFLSEGMDRVPARADEIFDDLMELDRCVVLFDEIDELIRLRSDPESDPFGRFLTTTMLPKLAKLWKQRRLLYFVATNDIDAADPAIQRSQRFDATIFVPPPSFAVKRKLLRDELGDVPDVLTEAAVNGALAADFGGQPLGVFALLRYDQIYELADRLQAKAQGEAVDGDDLDAVLTEMGEELKEREWKNNERSPFKMFDHWEKGQRRDGRALRLVRVESEPPSDPQFCEPFHVVDGVPRYYKIAGPFEQAVETLANDTWKLSVDGWSAADEFDLWFRVDEKAELETPAASEERETPAASEEADRAET